MNSFYIRLPKTIKIKLLHSDRLKATDQTVYATYADIKHKPTYLDINHKPIARKSSVIGLLLLLESFSQISFFFFFSGLE